MHFSTANMLIRPNLSGILPSSRTLHQLSMINRTYHLLKNEFKMSLDMMPLCTQLSHPDELR